MTPRVGRVVMTGLGLLFSSAGELRAQCPDGTPPPCAPSAPARRAAPAALDDRTWIVLPFDNVSRAPDIEWLRDGSVNLLYLDLSRWHDVRVVDDDRVADLLRTLPPAQHARLGLETGLQVARRAGAGRLVLGDLLKVGSRIAVVAKVYEVRSGRQTRLVRAEAAAPDSLMSVFGRLARGILDVPASVEAVREAAGTSSIEAYREYVAGVRAMNRWELDSARTHLQRAVALDSTFALAHYRLSAAYWWGDGFDEARQRTHSEAAARFGASLPPRERQLIEARVAMVDRRWARACEISAVLVDRDSADAEAWYNLGECSYHDDFVVAIGGDTARLAFRASWNTAVRAFERVIELDPTYHLAYYHILDVLRSDNRFGCRSEPERVCAYRALVLEEADTLVTVPVPDQQWRLAQRERAGPRAVARRANLQRAREVAARWVTSGPDEYEARNQLTSLLMLTGDLDGAERELAAATRLARGEQRLGLLLSRVDILLKRDRPAEAVQLADSLAAVGDTNEAPEHLSAEFGAMFGRFRRVSAHWPDTVPFGRFVRAVAVAGAGVVPPDLERTEHLYDSVAVVSAAQQGRAAPPRASRLAATSLLAFPGRPIGPAHDTASTDLLFRAQALLGGGSTAAARRTLAAFDSVLATLPETEPERLKWLPLTAEVHLALGDTGTALAQLEQFERRLVYLPLFHQLAASPLLLTGITWGRAWLRLGDLAAAVGHRDVALRAYRRVVAYWSGGDPEVQGFVARARAELERLGPP